MGTLKESLMRAEGLRLKLYRDTENFWSIGYGRCLDKRGITQVEAEYLLDNDIDAAKKQYEQLPGWVKSKCNEIRREVIIEMIFQLGLGGVLKFKKMLAAIQAGDFDKAAEEMLASRWHEQTPARCEELSERMRAGV